MNLLTTSLLIYNTYCIDTYHSHIDGGSTWYFILSFSYWHPKLPVRYNLYRPLECSNQPRKYLSNLIHTTASLWANTIAASKYFHKFNNSYKTMWLFSTIEHDAFYDNCSFHFENNINCIVSVLIIY